MVEFSAMYKAKCRIAYTKEYTDRRRRDLDKLIRDELLAEPGLDDDHTMWFGHSKSVAVTIAGPDRSAVKRAAARLQERLERCSFEKLIPVTESAS